MIEEREHDVLSENCWCHPILYYEAPNGNQVWVHQYEDDPEGPPPEALMDAIVGACFDDDDWEGGEVVDDN